MIKTASTHPAMATMLHVPGFNNLSYNLQLLSFYKKGVQWYYKPEIDALYRNRTGTDATLYALVRKRARQQADKFVVENSALEKTRRLVRLRIIRYAQILWEGDDPNPEIHHSCGPDGVLHEKKIPNPRLQNRRLYQPYREAWAPTAKLGQFLFPEYLISHKPTQTAPSDDGGWLKDPTKYFRRCTAPESIPNAWVSEKAQAMIDQLVPRLNDPTYYRVGSGGAVDAWINAARHWHIKRLEKEIQSRNTVNMAYIREKDRSNVMYFRLLNLRFQLGLQEKATDTRMSKPPRRYGLLDAQYFESFEDYRSFELHAARVQASQEVRIKHFNKIIRECCATCPNSGGLFFPMGLEGLVRHMEFSHPAEFWIIKKFHVIG
jgi:hypothetical protein